MNECISISNLVRPLFRVSDGRGIVAMLECYFDDSGTHAGSKIAVWGGIIGKPAQFDEFSTRWSEILKSPLPNRKPIGAMHLSALRQAKGEFFGYGQGEIDLLTRKFRDVIVYSGLECIAYLVSCEDWLKASNERDRKYLGDARNFAFSGILEFIAAASTIGDGQVSCHFDAGAQSAVMHMQKSIWGAARAIDETKVHFGFSPVQSLLPLQGADMVAYEAYHYGLHLIDPAKHPENPHFIDLRNRANVAFMSLHEPEMREHLAKWRAVMADVFKAFGDAD